MQTDTVKKENVCTETVYVPNLSKTPFFFVVVWHFFLSIQTIVLYDR
jgi:hypothetical protein